MVALNGKILSIKEVFSYDVDDGWSYSSYDGFEIVTQNNVIFIGVDNVQCCCEDWGYMVNEDDISAFIGANLVSINVIDTDARKQAFTAANLDMGDVMFVDIVTTLGTLQFSVYNGHNGYYGHDAVIVVNGGIIQQKTL